MGDWYDFDIRVIDGREVSGFCYCNQNTDWKEVFVELNDEQAEFANKYNEECIALDEKKNDYIKSCIAKGDRPQIEENTPFASRKILYRKSLGVCVEWITTLTGIILLVAIAVSYHC